MSLVRKNIPLYIMSGILLVYGVIVSTGALLPVLQDLKSHKAMDLMVTMSFILGGIGLVGAFFARRRLA